MNDDNKQFLKLVGAMLFVGFLAVCWIALSEHAETTKKEETPALSYDAQTFTVDIDKAEVVLPESKTGCRVQKVAKVACLVCGEEFDCNYFIKEGNK
jgi:hypothetical protein